MHHLPLHLALEVLACALYLCGVAYLLLALWCVARFPAKAHLGRTARAAAAGKLPAISILKPLCGNEPELEDNLRSFFQQDYDGEVQIVFGAYTAQDPGLKAALRVAAEHPAAEVAVMAGGDCVGPNRKVANLANMARLARHDLLVISDSDARLQRQTLRALIQPFRDPRVGAVTCLFRGALPANAGLATRLAALRLNAWFLPSALIAKFLAPVKSCYGPLTAIRRSVLDRAGGFTALADHAADDHELGQITVRQGLKVSVPPALVETLVHERSLQSLLAHEIRWARVTRATTSAGHTASVVSHSLPVLFTLSLALGSGWAWAALGTYMALRFALAGLAESRFESHLTARRWLGAAALVVPRECLCFLVWAISFCGHEITWRGRRFAILARDRLIERGGASRAPQPAGAD